MKGSLYAQEAVDGDGEGDVPTVWQGPKFSGSNFLNGGPGSGSSQLPSSTCTTCNAWSKTEREKNNIRPQLEVCHYFNRGAHCENSSTLCYTKEFTHEPQLDCVTTRYVGVLRFFFHVLKLLLIRLPNKTYVANLRWSTSKNQTSCGLIMVIMSACLLIP